MESLCMTIQSELSRAYGRYYCSANPLHRVFPYDQFDAFTEAPLTGKSGEAVLLTSLNSGLPPEAMRWAWCWACNEWVQCFKRTQHELIADYLKRKGISIRLNGQAPQSRAKLATLVRAVRRKV
jgi:hypothetical protein